MIYMINRAFATLVSALLLVCIAAASAQADDAPAVAGLWRTIDDATLKPKGVVRIFERDGALFGIVEQSLVETSPKALCEDCTDDRRNRPIIGLEIIRDLHQDGDEWSGGSILDPDNGRVYRCRLHLTDGGQKLAVRGYLGISLLGRTQTWERIE